MKNIMVVDNHPALVTFMSKLLRNNGYQVMTAEDGLSALDILQENRPDIIFIDLIMPNISGDKLCRIIRSIPEMKSVYLVILSAVAAEKELDIREFGADACIAKGPFNRMGKQVLMLLDKLKKKKLNGLSRNIIGIEDSLKREITEELLTSRKHLEVMLGNMSEGIMELTPEGKIIYVNSASMGLMGMPEEKLLASDFIGFFSGMDRERLVRLLDMDVEPGERIIPYDSPVKINEREFAINILPIQDENSRSMILILSDVTEKNRLKAQLQRAQKMEAMGVLAGGVAHDLNNILSGLVSYPELLLMELPEHSPLRQPILTIQKSGAKAEAMVRDLLTIARGAVPITEVVSLNNIISDYMKSPEFDRMISFHPKVIIDTKLDENLMNILGSPVQLFKVIMNLVSNAAEAMPEGGKISLITRNRNIDKPLKGYEDIKEGEYTTLVVSDTGKGISVEDMEKIFEPFFTKKSMGRSGTGLGMAVVWGTVKGFNGFIDVQSEIGKGTAFTLYFPVTRREAVNDVKGTSLERVLGGGQRILVVDDVEEQREIAEEILKKLGYTVRSVSNGEEAVEYLESNDADLVLLDMIMDPGMDGLETYKKILEIHPKQKAIITSGFSETERVREVQKLGAGAYIKKPYLLESLGCAIRSELYRDET